MSRTHERSIDLACSRERVFEALVRPSAIRAWWGAGRVIVQPWEGGHWSAAWGADEDAPDYTTSAVLERFDPPRAFTMAQFRYHARAEGPLPFDACAMRTTFMLEEGPGGCRLMVRQEGFPDGPEADAFYAGCEVGWERTLAALKAYLS